MWDIEEIPDDATLYRRVPGHLIIDGEVGSDAFQNTSNTTQMSTNWSLYATAEETREQVTAFGKDPKTYGVVAMSVADVKRKIITAPQTIDHCPDEALRNRAHTHVTGRKKKATQEEFVEIAPLCLHPASNSSSPSTPPIGKAEAP